MEFLGFTTQKGDVKQKGESNQKTERNVKMLQSTKVTYSLCVITAIALAIRLHRLDSLEYIAWDETHFGKMAGWYINQSNFFDLHPPLGKEIIAGMGYLTGYDASEPFQFPGYKFENYEKVIGMRIGCTILGMCVVPFSFLFVHAKTKSLTAAILASSFTAFDNGLIVLTRHILLDPIMICFIFGSAMGDAKFRSTKKVFGAEWWSWLLFTGMMLGCAISTKHVGLFVVGYVGISTIQELWQLMGDKKTSLVEFAKHFLARFVALILVPAMIYLGAFYVHFMVAHKSNYMDETQQPLWRTTITESTFHNMNIQKYLSYNLDVKFENPVVKGGYLHSHPQNYPKGYGLRQQMVTGYLHEDPNNFWFFKPWGSGVMNKDDNLVRNGDLIVLEHRTTGRNLHSHKFHAPVSSEHYQVTGYGWLGKGDANDVWRVHVKGEKIGAPIEVLKSVVILRHNFLGCELTMSGYHLAYWGYGQGEIICSTVQTPERSQNLTLSSSEWNVLPVIQGYDTDILPETAKPAANQEMINTGEMASSFWTKFKLYHEMIFYVGKIIGKESKGKLSDLRQDAPTWPLNKYAQTYTGNFNTTRPMVFMLGHPVLWGVNLVVICLLPVLIPLAIISQRQVLSVLNESHGEATIDSHVSGGGCDSHVSGGGWCLLGWALHYLPFWLMPRVLYQHHYYPASVFISMFTAILIDYFIRDLSPKVKSFITLAILFTMVTIFLLFSPVVYGLVGTRYQWENSTYHYLHWNSKWDM